MKFEILSQSKKIIKNSLPPFLSRFITGLFYGWYGNYSTWSHARSKCSGYDYQEILDKVKESTLKVKKGLVAYERDSVNFSEIQYSFPLLSGLMWIAACNDGKLNVLDFGGSLGSSYYQNRLFLESLPEVEWAIVEQADFVKVGHEFFSDEKVKFYYAIDECLAVRQINVILLSSVLQYLEDPYRWLDMIKRKRLKYIIFDRTSFVNGKDRITIQIVNPAVYKASYPCWFFNKEKFLKFMETDYDLMMEFDTPDRANIKSDFKGFLFRLKDRN
jgi:putative methyltransferase (TIGR04325 family)